MAKRLEREQIDLLAAKAGKGDLEAAEKLTQEVRLMLSGMARKFNIVGMDQEDKMSICLINLIKVYKAFSLGRNSGFITLLHLSTQRVLIDAQRASIRNNRLTHIDDDGEMEGNSLDPNLATVIEKVSLSQHLAKAHWERIAESIRENRKVPESLLEFAKFALDENEEQIIRNFLEDRPAMILDLWEEKEQLAICSRLLISYQVLIEELMAKLAAGHSLLSAANSLGLKRRLVKQIVLNLREAAITAT